MNSFRSISVGAICLLLWLSPCSQHSKGEESAPIQAELVGVQKIWDKAPHNAFTDLIRWRDKWYCAFREGKGHAGDRGVLRILTSDDGENWESAAVLEDEVHDLRDANLSVTPDDRLMAVGGAQITKDGKRTTGTFASYSNDGKNWTTPELIVPQGRWMWGVTWHDGKAWGVSYPAYDRPGVSSLLVSEDGHDFETAIDSFLDDGQRPTEARIRFAQDGTGYCLHRRDGKGNHAYMGSANPPYDKWEWKELDRYLGGPNHLQLPSGEWVAAGRLTDGAARTALLYVDHENSRLIPLVTFPSGGDTSYPGLVWHDGLLWVSYYSSHEGRTSIYLAKVKISDADTSSTTEDSP